jgi:hypothetical protein
MGNRDETSARQFLRLRNAHHDPFRYGAGMAATRDAGSSRGRGPLGRGPLPVHPLLLGAFPVLFLFAQNIVQQVTLEPLVVPLAAAIAGAAVLLLAASTVLRDWLRGAFAASLLLVLFFSFGHVWNLLRGQLHERTELVVAYALIAVVGLLLAWRGGRWVAPFTRAANVGAALLVAFNVIRIAQFALGAPTVSSAAAAGPVHITTPVSQLERRPDIYYVILDRYSSASSLEKFYGFDNRPFLDELEGRGFVIADGSWANYVKTSLSVLSSMNMDYLDGPALKQAGGESLGPVHSAFRNHLAAPVALKGLGYEYVHIGSAWEPTAKNIDADRLVRWRPGSEFTGALLTTSAWSLTQPDVPLSKDPEAPTEVPLIREQLREDTIFQFDALEDAAARPGPTFVFAHILMPHNPWRFNADGSAATEEQIASRSRDENFLQHVQWTNRRVLEALDRILDVPPAEQPVVILQADEGQYPIRYDMDQVGFDWLHARSDEIENKYAILNAVHTPGVDPAEAGFHDRISPVNEFRVVFNADFDAKLPLLPDITYLSPDAHRIYDFVKYDRPDQP